jgi:hypothetical protein
VHPNAQLTKERQGATIRAQSQNKFGLLRGGQGAMDAVLAAAPENVLSDSKLP